MLDEGEIAAGGGALDAALSNAAVVRREGVKGEIRFPAVAAEPRSGGFVRLFTASEGGSALGVFLSEGDLERAEAGAASIAGRRAAAISLVRRERSEVRALRVVGSMKGGAQAVVKREAS